MDKDFIRKNLPEFSPVVPHDLEKGGHPLVRVLPEALYTQARLAYRRYSYKNGKKTSPFTLYKTQKTIFIHIPKNAGTFINEVVYPSLPAEQSTHINAHHSAQYLRRLDQTAFDGYSKFAILRHPFARLKSAFNYLKFTSEFETDRQFSDAALKDFADFKEFCSTVTPEVFQDLLKWPHFQPQTSFVCTHSGALMVDALTTLEGLTTGMRVLGTLFGKQYDNVPYKAPALRQDMTEGDPLIARYYQADLFLWRFVHQQEACFSAVDL